MYVLARSSVLRDRGLSAAACRDSDPELFFPVGSGDSARRQAEAAKAVCRRCPLVVDCLRWATATGQDSGVWGARTAAERRALRTATLRASYGLLDEAGR
ncbi:MAG TPA: WhiB family transcriptional regulator [Pseudonocardia sp.]|nr:WhiB family transcriptional regulator [Pseudonocardia sp.]